MKNEKNGIVLFLVILCSIIVGGFLGEFFKDNSLLSFLAWGFPIGTTDGSGNMKPLLLNLKMIELNFGLLIHINLASIIALILGLYFYTKM